MLENAPPFDPLNPTREESDEMFNGYRAGVRGDPLPALASQAYEHGHRMARNDRAGVVDADQRDIARRIYDKLIVDGEVKVLKTAGVGKTEDLPKLFREAMQVPARRAPGRRLPGGSRGVRR